MSVKLNKNIRKINNEAENRIFIKQYSSKKFKKIKNDLNKKILQNECLKQIKTINNYE